MSDGVTDEAGAEPSRRLAQSDWTDQDLLTKGDARERLVDEIARTSNRLEQLEAGVGDSAHVGAEITMLTRRLIAMKSARDEYNQDLDPR
jgi:hypothetical protein